MPKRAQRLVAIHYEHPLLGEGIARILLLETDAEVVAVAAGDRSAVESVLARRPAVVIFDGSRGEQDCRRLAPHAVLIDVTSAMSIHASPAAPDLNLIILAARGGDVPSGPTA